MSTGGTAAGGGGARQVPAAAGARPGRERGELRCAAPAAAARPEVQREQRQLRQRLRAQLQRAAAGDRHRGGRGKIFENNLKNIC